MSSDRNLLFGILAVQMNFISRDALISAMNAWVLSKEVPLGDLLQQQNALTTDRAQLLEAMVKEHLKTHENDPQKSLAALSSVESMREALLQVADPQVQRSLLAVVGHPSPVIDGTKVGPQDYQSVGSTRSFVSPDSSSRFRILRPHAKGGLGEVFVAEDTELHREVALKEIQGQHAHNENSRGRFILEAEVTGGLEHPNIVPVYGLGTYADGRPYYAMRFIRGDSLKEAIERFYKTTFPNASERNLAFRNLLKRFVDVCNAIAYAHSRGILHRDLKPGNIMLGKYGETLVVDWGLAKAVGGGSRDGIDENAERTLNPSGSSYAETLAGSAIGTPAFMSPEQAAGRLDQLGPASDVYSLGATLYVLQTGELPFKPSDSILKQVEEGEFPAPRQVRSDIPLPLNAIVLKAMAKKMENRYLTATALAEEVEHYLADESVTAYREPMAERTKRWARKHPGMVAGVAATLLVGVLGLVVGSVVLRGKNEELENANGALELANNSLSIAIKNAKDKESIAIAERERAHKAEADTLADYRASTDEAIEHLIGSKPELSQQERTYLFKTIQRWQVFTQRKGIDEQSRAIRAEGHTRVGSIWQTLGDLAESHKEYMLAYTLYVELVNMNPGSQIYRKDLAGLQSNLGLLLDIMGKPKEAQASFEEAKTYLSNLIEQNPSVISYKIDLATLQSNYGMVLRNTGDYDKAITNYQESIRVMKNISTEHPSNTEYQLALARFHGNLGVSLSNLSKYTQAKIAYESARAIYIDYLDKNRGDVKIMYAAAKNHISYGVLLAKTGKLRDANSEYELSCNILENLIGRYPSIPDYQKDMASTYGNMAIVHMGLGEKDTASSKFQASIDILKKLSSRLPSNVDYQLYLGGGYCNYAMCLSNKGDHEKSIELYGKAISTLQPLYDNSKLQVITKQYLRNSYSGRASVFRHLKKFNKAIEDYQQAAKFSSKTEEIEYNRIIDNIRNVNNNK